jgi:hypothetical protein
MTDFSTAFDAIQTALGSAVNATLRRGRDTLTVMCGSGVQGIRTQDETGRIIGKTASVRYKLEAEQDLRKPIAEGDIVELIRANKTEEMRVVGRMDIAWLVRLTLIAEFE